MKIIEFDLLIYLVNKYIDERFFNIIIIGKLITLFL